MRHAYLIVAHHQPELLKVLLRLLDDDRNDIFLHVDARADNFVDAELTGLLTRSRLHLIPRTKVNWGGFSMINCELLLMRAASDAGAYDYFHLLSGVDLPLKKQDVIHEFFVEHRGQEFVHFEEKDVDYRIRYYYPLQERKGRNPDGRPEYLRNLSVGAQHVAGVNRIRSFRLTPRFGSQWFSITADLVALLLAQEDQIRKTYKLSLCCDEVFLQTTMYGTTFMDNLYRASTDDHASSLRFIDWKRGAPYVFRIDDYDALVGSPDLFARKFDLTVDREVVARLEATLGDHAAG